MAGDPPHGAETTGVRWEVNDGSAPTGGATHIGGHLNWETGAIKQICGI